MGIALLELLLIVFTLSVIAVFTTQIVLPMLRGTPLFPLLRKSTPLKEKVAAAEKELEETTELVTLEEQLEEINRRKAELEKK